MIAIISGRDSRPFFLFTLEPERSLSSPVESFSEPVASGIVRGERIEAVSAWKQSWGWGLLMPGGALLGVGYLLLQTAWFKLPLATLNFYLYAFAIVGLLLARRFHTSRIFGALVLLVLAHRALEFFSDGRIPKSGPGLTALEAISFLLPLNLLLLACSKERGFTLVAWGPKLLVLFVESVFLAVICRPHPAPGSDLFRGAFVNRAWVSWSNLPQVSLMAAVVVLLGLWARFVHTRHPLDAAFIWADLISAIAFGAGGTGRIASGLMATTCLILALSVLESSYRMAYYDELTGIPGRRAFNEALLQLRTPYTMAVVDIDHFKRFNDTYGHDTGDDVLRMVAGKLAAVTGGGRAFRVGGEEFNIIFAGKSGGVQEHLELLRTTVESAQFRLRGSERRAEPRGAERRRPFTNRKLRDSARSDPTGGDQILSVTVSIGFAEGTLQRPEPAQVVAAADQALYEAKANGRNRVVAFGNCARRPREKRKKKPSVNIA